MKSIFAIPELVLSIFRYDSERELDYGTLGTVSFFFGIILYIVNFKNVDYLPVVLLTYVVGTALLLVPLIIKRVQNKRAFCIRFVIFIELVLTVYALFGVSEGMGNYWSILAIFVVMILFGMPTGILCGTYFFILCVVFFWSPIRNIMPYQYTGEYAVSFPVIFLFSFFGSFVVNLFYKKGCLEREKSDERLQKELAEALEGIDEAMIESVTILTTLIDEKDQYTKEHSVRVARYARLIADRYGFGNDVKRMRSIYNAAMLHDIGKIAIPDEILKQGKSLSDDEYETMKRHTEYGEEILKELTFLPNVYYGAKYHHERCDGKGYPQGLHGKEIPIEGKIISVADTIDAMNSKRVYRDPCSREYIVRTLKDGEGDQFDFKVAETACELIREGKIKILADENKDK